MTKTGMWSILMGLRLHDQKSISGQGSKDVLATVAGPVTSCGAKARISGSRNLNRYWWEARLGS